VTPQEELKKYQEMEKRLRVTVKRKRLEHEISLQARAIYEKENETARKDIESITANEIANELGNAAGELKAMQIKVKEKKEKVEGKKTA